MQRLILALALIAVVLVLARRLLMLLRPDGTASVAAKPPQTTPAPLVDPEGPVARIAFAGLFLLVLSTSAGWLGGL